MGRASQRRATLPISADVAASIIRQLRGFWLMEARLAEKPASKVSRYCFQGNV